MIKVLIADDQAMIRGAFAALLSFEDDIQVVGEAARGDEVVAAVEKFTPDVVLLDIEMPGLSGIDAANELLRRYGVRVLIVTTFGRAGYVRRALDLGVHGFILKDAPVEELLQAIRDVYAGGHVVDPSLATQSLFAGTNPLTTREQEVLRVALTGLPVAEIAQRVFLTPGTVRNYLSSAIGKTGATTRMEAARIAHSNGWL
ncbi:response regulator [Arcanobacterium canis]|uniref:Response regulator transcription factor n=1 Tax=Arcanobacterium canis TaxID=999183 RepID=A0ABY8FZ50_9ACTO|nr:response regulator transcription factor [Arcanobacterium canis]WFM83015.1 response regulator transcription factor [Arcanobacterium canis]